jgi:hypothetical protein
MKKQTQIGVFTGIIVLASASIITTTSYFRNNNSKSNNLATENSVTTEVVNEVSSVDNELTVTNTELIISTENETEVAEAIFIEEETQNTEALDNTEVETEVATEVDILTSQDDYGFYRYCPVGIRTEDNSLNVFYCKNVEYGVIRDSIYNAELIETGQLKNEHVVLSPSASGWDSVHVCDPSIVKGAFQYAGYTYSYLMAYLGCNTTDSQRNQIGLAVSDSLTGGWIKCDSINPIIQCNYDSSHSEFQWGVGQPCLINMNQNGLVTLFYTSGTWNLTCTYAVNIDFSQASPVVSGVIQVSNSGTGDFISNGDFSYSNGALYLCCDTHPFGGSTLSVVSDKESIYSASWDGNLSTLQSIVWTPVTKIGYDTTGHGKNHNSGFVRNVYGYGDDSEVLVTVADEKSTFTDSLWTYKIQYIKTR